MTEFKIGDKVRVKPEARLGWLDTEYEIVTETEFHYGLTSENHDPEKQETLVQLAVKKDSVIAIESSIDAADISSTPVPQIKDLRNF